MADSLTSGVMTGADAVKAQYRDSARLARRANIHSFGTAPVGWFEWTIGEARLADGAAVLDVGCGPGWLWGAANVPAGLALTLVDLSEGMVSEALERVQALGRFRSVAGRPADAQALPFPDASFDTVLACHMLYHVPDPGAALDETIRVLRPGGTLAVTTNGDDNMADMYELAHAVWGGLAVDPSGVTFDIDAATAALAARLPAVEVAIYRDELQVTDGEAIVGALTSYPPGDSATDAQLAVLRGMIAARMAEHGGVFPIAKRVGLVRGRKAGKVTA